MTRPIPAFIGSGQADREGERFIVGGREWEVYERLPFGKNLCRSGGRIGEWTDRAIREAQARNIVEKSQ